MLESLVISSVFQSLPTIYPISIEESSTSYPPKRQKQQKQRKMERVKKLSLEKRAAFPSSLFAKTAGIFDNILCCQSYAEQQMAGEAVEREHEYREETSPGCGLDSAKGSPNVFKVKKTAPVRDTCSSNRQRQRQYDFVDQRSPPQQHRKGKGANANGTNSTGTRANAPYSPVGSSYSTATTVTANTYNTGEDSTGSSARWSTSSTPRSLRTTETNELFLRESSADQNDKVYGFLTDRTISVPLRSHRSIKLDPEKRRWSEGCIEFERMQQHQQQQQQQQQQQHADYYVPDEEVIRKVQSESLAELPYLSMTEGYRC